MTLCVKPLLLAERNSIDIYIKSDYKDIDPIYGTLSDVDDLIAGLRRRDMKLMMDLVVNHTSDQVSNDAGIEPLDV